MTSSAIDHDDVQGLVRYGYAHMTEARFLLLRVADPGAARAWLRAAPVTTAARTVPRPATALQVAFTREGLEALGVPAGVLQGFSAEFVSGMAGEESRSRRLGDVGASARPAGSGAGRGRFPMWWSCSMPSRGGSSRGRGSSRAIPGTRRSRCFPVRSRRCWTAWSRSGSSTASASRCWTGNGAGPSAERDLLEYGNVLSLGEVLLGYPNEYGKYTDRPLVDRQDDRGAGLPPAEDAPELRDLGRNGSYLVFRQLRQDVQGFWQFLHRQANGDPRGRARAGRGDGGADAGGRSAPRDRRPPDLRRRPARSRRGPLQPVHVRLRRRTARVARSAPTSGAPTRATRTSRAAPPVSSAA